MNTNNIIIFLHAHKKIEIKDFLIVEIVHLKKWSYHKKMFSNKTIFKRKLPKRIYKVRRFIKKDFKLPKRKPNNITEISEFSIGFKFWLWSNLKGNHILKISLDNEILTKGEYEYSKIYTKRQLKRLLEALPVNILESFLINHQLL
jgi:hypothetical protein